LALKMGAVYSREVGTAIKGTKTEKRRPLQTNDVQRSFLDEEKKSLKLRNNTHPGAGGTRQRAGRRLQESEC